MTTRRTFLGAAAALAALPGGAGGETSSNDETESTSESLDDVWATMDMGFDEGSVSFSASGALGYDGERHYPGIDISIRHPIGEIRMTLDEVEYRAMLAELKAAREEAVAVYEEAD